MFYDTSEASIMFVETHFTVYPVFGFREILVARCLLYSFLKIKPNAHNPAIPVHMQETM